MILTFRGLFSYDLGLLTLTFWVSDFFVWWLVFLRLWVSDSYV